MRTPLLLVLAAAAVALVFLFRGCQPEAPATPPAETPAAPPTPAPATAEPPAVTAATAPPPAPERTDAAPAAPAAPTPFTVTGVVLADRSAPDLSGARVAAYEGRPEDEAGSVFGGAMSPGLGAPAFLVTGEPIAFADVAADGTFVLKSPARHLRLSLRHDTYLLPAPEIVHVPADTERTEVVLVPLLGSCLRGRLLGQEVAGVEQVRVVAEVDPTSVVRDTRVFVATLATTGREGAKPAADGTFVLPGLIPGSSLTLIAEGDRATGRADVPALAPGEVRDVVLPVQGSTSLEVMVRDEAGQPIADASVSARGLHVAGMLAALQARRAKSDATGLATIRGLERQIVRVDARARGHATDSTEFDLLTASGPVPRVEFTLGRGGVVTGLVVDAQGNPVAEARVAHQPVEDLPLLGELTSQLGNEQMAAIADSGTRTDAAGRFELGGIADDGRFQLVAAHPDHAAAWANGVRMGDRDVRIQLGRLGGVRGKVRAVEDGGSLGDVRVELLRTAFLVMTIPVRREALPAGGDGSFTLERVAPGSYTLRAVAAGRSAAQVDVTVRDGIADAGELRLERAAGVRGVVVDDRGEPVLGALVRRRQGAMADNPMLALFSAGGAQARTDAQGRFHLAPLPPGRLQLLVNADGFASGRSDRLQLTAGQELTDVRIALDHGGTIRGRLRTGPGQRPDEFLLMVQEQATQTTHSSETEPDGTFVVTDLDAGQWTVQAMPRDLMLAFQGHEATPGQPLRLGETLRKVTDSVVSRRCTVRAGETTEVELDTAEIVLGSTWHLAVEVGGTKLTEGVLELTGEDGRVRVAMASGGTATLGGVRPGSYTLQARSGLSMAPVGASQTVVFPDGVDEHHTTVSLPAGELRGRVVDADGGRPLAAVLVQLLHEGAAERDDSVGTAVSDGQGEFVFRGIADGKYGLLAVDAIGSSGRDGSTRLDGVTVAGGTTTAPVELRARPAAAATVLVTSTSGAPLPGATVLCVDGEGRPLGGRALATTGADGRAAIGGLPPGATRVVGRAPGFAPGVSAPQTVESGQSVSFTLSLGGGTRTTLQVVDRQGRPVGGAQIGARCDGGPWLPALVLLDGQRGDGAFDVGRLGAGAWEFRASHPSFGTRSVARTLSGTGSVTILLAP